MEDTYRTKGLRKRLVDTIISKGIKNQKVLDAIGKIPRHFFMDTAFVERAYEDSAFPIASGQTISQPYTVAFQTELLDVKPEQKVLEIGTGSGYQCAVLCDIGAKVFSIERQKTLYTSSKTMLKKLGYKAELIYGDGFKGLPVFAPFERIIVTCGAPFIPEDLLKQLAIGGRMVIPVGDKTQKMLLVTRKSETEFVKKDYGSFMFVPMLKDIEK